MYKPKASMLCKPAGPGQLGPFRLSQVVHRPSSKSRRFPSAARASYKETYLRTAAERAVDAFVRDGAIVGLGHGTMVIYALEAIGRRLKENILTDVSCLSISDVATAEAAVQGIPLEDINDEALQADLALVEADEVDCTGLGLSFITGRAPLGVAVQQPQLPQLRSLISRSRHCIGLLADSQMVTYLSDARKLITVLQVVRRLGGSLPVVIDAEDWEATAEELDDIFLGDAEVWRRSNEEAANPRGGSSPYVSSAGHNILDIKFLSSLKLYGKGVEYRKIADEIMGVKGVITHGLILDTANAAVIADGPEAKIIEKGLLFGFKDERQ